MFSDRWNAVASGRPHRDSGVGHRRHLVRFASTLRSPSPATAPPLTVHEVPGEPESSRVEWSGVFTPVGVGDEEAVALFHGIDAEGLDALLRTVTDA